MIKETISMSNIAIVGTEYDDRTELMKQMAYAFSTDTINPYRVVVIDDTGAFEAINQMPYVNEKEERFFNVKLNDFSSKKWRDLLMEQSFPFVFMMNDIGQLIDKYQEREKVTEVIDFLYYLSEIGKGIGTYTVVSADSVIKIMDNQSMNRLLLENAKTTVLFKLSKEDSDFYQYRFQLQEEDANKLVTLEKGKYMLAQQRV